MPMMRWASPYHTRRPAYSATARPSVRSFDAYRSGRVPHAWLIGGPPGIGKATLAYRLARFVLAHPDPKAAEVKAAQTLELPHRSSGSTAHRGAGTTRPAGSGAARSTKRQASCVPGYSRRGCSPNGLILRLDRRGGGLARRDCRLGRRAERFRRQRAAEDFGRAAAPRGVAAGEPCARARVADDPLAHAAC